MADPTPLSTLVASYAGISHTTTTPSGDLLRVWFRGQEGVVGSVSVNVDLERKAYELLSYSLLKGGNRASLRGVIELLGLVNTFLGRLEVIGYSGEGRRPVPSEVPQ